jgi:hypothetical protein
LPAAGCLAAAPAGCLAALLVGLAGPAAAGLALAGVELLAGAAGFFPARGLLAGGATTFRAKGPEPGLTFAESERATARLAEESDRARVGLAAGTSAALLGRSTRLRDSGPAPTEASRGRLVAFGTGLRSTAGVIEASRGRLGVRGGVFFGLELASKTLILSEMGVRPMAERRDMPGSS